MIRKETLEKIWIFFLGFILFYIVENLTKTKYDVSYFSKFDIIKSLPTISMCIPLRIESVDQFSMDDCKNEIHRINPYVNLICFVSNLMKTNKKLIPSKIIEHARLIDIHQMFNVSTTVYKFKKSSIYLNNFHICMTYDIYGDLNKKTNLSINETNLMNVSETNQTYQQLNLTDLKENDLSSGTSSVTVNLIVYILNVYRVNAKLFIFTQGEYSYYFSLSKFHQHCHKSQCNAGQLAVLKTNYAKLRAPYTTNCFKYSNATFNFTRINNPIFSRVACLSECMKSIYTNPKFLYTDKDLFTLNTTMSVEYNESYCRSQCQRSDCINSFYYTSSWRNLSTIEPLIKILINNYEYDIIAYSTNSTIVYLLQITSYLCLIYNNNLIVQILKLFNELANFFCKFGTNQYLNLKFVNKLGNSMKNEFCYIRFYFLILILAIFIFIKSFLILMSELDKLNDLTEMAFTQYPINYSHLTVTICFPLVDILKDQEIFFNNFESFRIKNSSSELNYLKLNNELLKNFTINQLNRLTKNETQLINASFVFNDLKSMELETNITISFQPTNRIIYRDIHRFNVSLYSKCFSYNVFKIEYPLQRLYRMSEVHFIILNGHQFSHFTITDNDQYPNYKDSKLFTVCNLQRYAGSSYEDSNCKNYQKSTDGCFRQNDCIENCIKETYAKKYDKIPFNVIYKLNDEIKGEKNELIDKIDTSFENQNLEFKSIEKECESLYELKDCQMILYANLDSCTAEDFTFKSIKIKLYIPGVMEYNVRAYSYSELGNQITTLQTVIFGYCVPGLLRLIFKIFRLIFRIKITSKQLRPLVRACLFLSMCYNFVMIIQRAIENDPLPNTLYKPFDDFELPRITVCVRYDYEEIAKRIENKNQTLTGHILYQETANISIEKLFSKIVFYSKDLNVITVNGDDMIDKDDQSIDNLQYEYFFFQSFKCFNIRINISYDTNNYDLFYIDDMIKIYLNSNAPIDQMVYSLSPNDTMNFNELDEFKHNCLHLISFEVYNVKYKDLFKYIKNPKLLYHQGHQVYDEENYINFLSDETQRLNMTAVFLPIFKEEFNIPMNYDRLLNLYRNGYINLNRISDDDPDYERIIYKSIKMHKKLTNTTMLIINPNYLYFNLLYTNKERPSTILLYLLNVISLWLDINVVDYPRVIVNFFKEIFRLFKSLKVAFF